MRILKSRKGDLSLNTIIVAAIVMIVLVVLVMVFTGRIKIFTDLLGIQTKKTCAGLGGRLCAESCPGYDIPEAEDTDSKNCCKWSYMDDCT